MTEAPSARGMQRTEGPAAAGAAALQSQRTSTRRRNNNSFAHTHCPYLQLLTPQTALPLHVVDGLQLLVNLVDPTPGCRLERSTTTTTSSSSSPPPSAHSSTVTRRWLQSLGRQHHGVALDDDVAAQAQRAGSHGAEAVPIGARPGVAAAGASAAGAAGGSGAAGGHPTSKAKVV